MSDDFWSRPALNTAHREVRAEKIVIAHRDVLSAELWDAMRSSVSVEVDDAHRIQRRMRAHILGMPDEPLVVEVRVTASVEIPADWWQAVRERWCPEWWLARYPVLTREVSQTETGRAEGKRYRAVCPHIATDERGTHLRWLADVDAGSNLL